ncbi:HprK-related kinase A [Pseudomaricurvus sp. HS19]|uniref:HprK-related kinase A n=1 Tax=Pseudomaricurvus sp. HS19 TaxID=2692626 RepID=UPI00192768CD
MNPHLNLKVGPFTVQVSSNIAVVLDGARLLYSDREIAPPDFVDFHISMARPSGLRGWWRPQVNFRLDGHAPFKPLPLSQALPMFEWGLNWCITSHCLDYLIIHAAVVEKNGQALVMPAPPGSGKSTLCAALVCNGWRLLSDELALLKLDGSGEVVPLARPVCLKNESVSLISGRFPQAQFGPVCNDTIKGDVAHMLAPADSVFRVEEAAKVQGVIFPRYIKGAETQLWLRSRAYTLLELAKQSFNFHVLGEQAYQVLRGVVDQSQCYDFHYSDLEQALQLFDELVDEVEPLTGQGDSQYVL